MVSAESTSAPVQLVMGNGGSAATDGYGMPIVIPGMPHFYT